MEIKIKLKYEFINRFIYQKLYIINRSRLKTTTMASRVLRLMAYLYNQYKIDLAEMTDMSAERKSDVVYWMRRTAETHDVFVKNFPRGFHAPTKDQKEDLLLIYGDVKVIIVDFNKHVLDRLVKGTLVSKCDTCDEKWPTGYNVCAKGCQICTGCTRSSINWQNCHKCSCNDRGVHPIDIFGKDSILNAGTKPEYNLQVLLRA